ncbi:MAG: DUF1080 domain-containing protein [Pirellulaceae bacterium]
MKQQPFSATRFTCVLLAFVFACGMCARGPAQEYLNGIKWEKPEIIQPGATDAEPPSDAIVLFDGKDLSQWKANESWEIKDGVMYCGKGVLTTKEEFGDCQLHIEWSAPTPPKGSSQGRGNSGVFLMGKYEIQVLDSYDNETHYDGQAGAIYKQTPPIVNAMRKPGEWNAYDIIWTAPRFNEDGTLKSPAFITALHNGVVILNHFELLGDTPFNRPPKYTQHADVGPISLQDHGNPVAFRNIWIRPVKEIGREQVREPFLRRGDQEFPIEK